MSRRGVVAFPALSLPVRLDAVTSRATRRAHQTVPARTAPLLATTSNAKEVGTRQR